MKVILSKKRYKLSLSAKKAMMGYVFVSPFIIGLLTFFLFPMIQSIVFSLNQLEVTNGGYKLIPNGWEYYHRAMNIHPTFKRYLIEAVMSMVTNVPLIVIFSFFAANLLNQRFKGRMTARAIFFLPVILTSGIILTVENGDLLQNSLSVGDAANAHGIGRSMDLARMLLQSKLDPRFIGYITGAVDHIYEIVVASGVQILVFLAGLQSIPPSLFEASNIEGATGWENFWKITFPMVSPLILVNTVYSIIDAFTSSSNEVMKLVRNVAFVENNYGFSSAMSWIYFVTIMSVLGIVIWIISKNVFYYE